MDPYQEVFKTNDLDQLKKMKGEAMKIEFVDGPFEPLHINTPRKTPYSYQGASKAKLEKLVCLGILELVKGSSDWISPMSFVPKPYGDVRLVADLVHLNKYVKRPIHPFQCLKDILAQIDQKTKYFAVFDAKSEGMGWFELMKKLTQCDT